MTRLWRLWRTWMTWAGSCQMGQHHHWHSKHPATSLSKQLIPTPANHTNVSNTHNFFSFNPITQKTLADLLIPLV